MGSSRSSIYQAGSFAVGNRLLDPDQRSVQADPERANALTCGHRACQGCGEALGARYVLDAAMRATGGAADRRQRDRLPRGLLDPVSRDVVADAVAALAVRQRARGRDRGRGGTAGQGRERHARRRPGRRRRHGRHRLRLPVGDVRAQRRRALHLLRQRGVHEHRRPALRRDAAGRAHGDDPGGGRRAGQPIRPGQERAADRDGPRDPLRRDGDRGRAARPRGQGGARDDDPRRRATCTCSCPARWAGAAASATRSSIARLAKETGLFPVFEAAHGEVTAVSKIRRRGAGRGVPEACRSATPTCSRPSRAPTSSRSSRRSPTATSAASACYDERRSPDGQAVRHHARRRLEPGQPDRHRGAPSARCTSTAWRRATTRARPARTCRGGSTTPRSGDYEAAWRRSGADNPFPAMMGRVCYHPCETACNRGQLDEAVGINSVERFLGDEAIQPGLGARPPAPRRRASASWSSARGPSGLSAAYHLARLGHAVTIHEAGPVPGGMMRFGIPTLPPAARRARRRDRADPRRWASSSHS